MKNSLNSRWEISGDRLVIRDKDGEVVHPTAMEIHGAAFEDQDRIGEAEPGNPRDALGDITFSRYPLQLRMRIGPAGNGAGAGLPVTLFGYLGSENYPLKLQDLEADSVIVRRRSRGQEYTAWHAIARGDASELYRLFEGTGTAPGQPLNLGNYLKLSLKQEFSRWFVDDSGEEMAAENLGESSARLDVPGLHGTLRGYQECGVRWLSLILGNNLGGILADEMGLGKTIQIISLLLLRNREQKKPSLVIAPATLLENWRRELAKFAPQVTPLVHRGPLRTGFAGFLRSQELVITSYGTLLRDRILLENVGWDLVILDEAHAIRNPDAQRSVAVKTLGKTCGIAVTGTPVQNRLTDLWSVIEFCTPGLLGSLEQFEHRFPDDVSGAHAVEPLVSPILLRRNIDDVLDDLPERIDIPRWIDSSSAAFVTGYRELVGEFRRGTASRPDLAGLMRLRQYCCHPHLLQDDTGDPVAASPKLELLLELIEQIIEVGDKAIVFASFTRMIDLLIETISSRCGIRAFVLDGRVDVAIRNDVIDEFSGAGASAVIVANPRAAGEGLNIIAANHAIHYNPEWNPATMDQATARVHRIGQKKEVSIYYLLHSNTVEEIMYDRLERKRNIAEGAVVGVDGEDTDMADLLKVLRTIPSRLD